MFCNGRKDYCRSSGWSVKLVVMTEAHWIVLVLAGTLIGAGLGAWIARLYAAGERSRLQAELDVERGRNAERESALEAARERLVAEVERMASKALRENNESFLKLAKENLSRYQSEAVSDLSKRERAIEHLVKPLSEALKRSEQQIDRLEKDRKEAYGSLRQQLESMQTTQQTLQSETRNLVKALRRPEVRGRWGEMTLKRLVELAGMVEHCDFVEQDTSGTEGARMRPDMVVNMPDDRRLVVDAKTPIDAYLDATEADDDAARETALKNHAAQVRKQVRELASKAYWQQFDPSPDFVVLFLPGDQFLSAALERDPALQEYALGQGVIIATPSNLMGLLKVVAYGWRQQQLAENAAEIRELAQEMNGRLATFTKHFATVGRQLKSAVDNYDKAVGSLESRVLVSARRISDLGVPGDELETPERIGRTPRLPQAEDEDDDG